MPITDASRAALGDSTKRVAAQEEAGARGVLFSLAVPVKVDYETEFQWVALHMFPFPAMWETAPSKCAARWLYELRKRKTLAVDFWADSWTAWMAKGLALTLPGGRGKVGVAKVRPVDLSSSSMVEKKVT